MLKSTGVLEVKQENLEEADHLPQWKCERINRLLLVEDGTLKLPFGPVCLNIAIRMGLTGVMFELN